MNYKSVLEWIPFTNTDETYDILKDHYWYLVLDGYYGTPVKAQWHSDTYQFTYLTNDNNCVCASMFDEPLAIVAFAELESTIDIIKEMEKNDEK